MILNLSVRIVVGVRGVAIELQNAVCNGGDLLGAVDPNGALIDEHLNELRTTAVLDYETKSSLRVRFHITDALGLSMEISPTITVLDRPGLPPLNLSHRN